MAAPVKPLDRISRTPYASGPELHRGELLCEFERDNRRYRVELRNHELWGIEAQIFQDELFLRGRRFYTRELAVQWAQRERAALLRNE